MGPPGGVIIMRIRIISCFRRITTTNKQHTPPCPTTRTKTIHHQRNTTKLRYNATVLEPFDNATQREQNSFIIIIIIIFQPRHQHDIITKTLRQHSAFLCGRRTNYQGTTPLKDVLLTCHGILYYAMITSYAALPRKTEVQDACIR